MLDEGKKIAGTERDPQPNYIHKRCNILAVVEIRTPTMTQTWIRSIIFLEVGRRRAGIHP